MLRAGRASVYRIAMDGDIALSVMQRTVTAQRAQGAAIIAYRRDAKDGQTRLHDLYHSHPMRVLFPRPARGDPATAAITTVSGGVAGGDRISVSVEAGDGTDVLALAQAAEKIYRAANQSPAEISLHLTAGHGATLEYLPQETILFDRARLMRNTEIRLADATTRVLAGEMVIFGRGAMGEVVETCQFSENWRLMIAGRTVWRDAFTLTPASAASPFGLDGARAMASVICVAPDPARLRDTIRAAVSETEGWIAGVTVIGPLLLLRFLGTDPAALRVGFMSCWSILRAEALGRPARLHPLIGC